MRPGPTARPLTPRRAACRRLAVAALVAGSALVAAATPTGPALAEPTTGGRAVTATWVRQVGVPGHADLYAWGAAAAPDGSTWVGDYNNHVVKRYDASGQLVAVAGGRGIAPGRLAQPFGLAVSPRSGRLYVADTVQGDLEVYRADGTPRATWDMTALGATYASRVAVDGHGRVLVVDSTPGPRAGRHRILVLDRQGRLLHRWHPRAGDGTRATDLRGVAVGGRDRVFVLDGAHGRVVVLDRRGRTLRTFASPGSGPGLLGADPRGIALDRARHRVYVTDASDGTVEVFTMRGAPVATWVLEGPEPGAAAGVREVAVDTEGLVHVSDYSTNRVVVLDPEGDEVAQVPLDAKPAPLGGLNQPEGVAVDPSNGDVLVSDTLNQRVQRFAADGTPLLSWGYRGRGTGRALDYPRGVAVDASDSSVWVQNSRSGNLKRFSADGQSMGAIGRRGSGPGQLLDARGVLVTADGLVVVPDSGNQRLVVMNRRGEVQWSAPCGAPAQAARPYLRGCTAVSVDADGQLWAAAPTLGAVQVFAPDGTLLHTYTARRLSTPYGVVVDGDQVFVSDLDRSRIVVLDREGDVRGSFGGPGSAHGQLRRPTALAVDPDGLLLICDTGNERIEVFDVD